MIGALHLGDGHLNDEAVAAFADGALSPVARMRALHHVETCLECTSAVAEQRAAAWALRSRANALPGPSAELMARLQSLPSTTPLGGSGPGPAVLLDGRPAFAAGPAVLRPDVRSRGPMLRHGALLGVAAAAITFGGSVALTHDDTGPAPAQQVAVVRPAQTAGTGEQPTTVQPAAFLFASGGH